MTKQLTSLLLSLATALAAAFPILAAEESEPLPPRLPLNELRVFAEVFDRFSEHYVEEIDDRTLLDNAIKGCCLS